MPVMLGRTFILPVPRWGWEPAPSLLSTGRFAIAYSAWMGRKSLRFMPSQLELSLRLIKSQKKPFTNLWMTRVCEPEIPDFDCVCVSVGYNFRNLFARRGCE